MTPQITETDRARIRILHYDAHFTQKQIAQQTGFTRHQVRHAIRNAHAAVRPGRPPTMTPAQKDELVAFVTGSRAGRTVSFLALSQTLFDGRFGEYVIRSSLRSRGYRRVAGDERLVREAKHATQRKQETSAALS